MKVTFLGTGAGRPNRTRNTSSLFLEFNRLSILVDAGEATQHQLSKAGIRLNRIDALFITHNHGDHIFGLPGLLSSISVEGRTETLKIICNDELKNLIKVIFKTTKTALGYKVKFVNSKDLDLQLSDEVSVDSHPLNHANMECYAFRFKEFKQNISIDKARTLGLQPGPIFAEFKTNGYVELDGQKITLDMVSDKVEKSFIICGDNEIGKIQPKSLIEFCSDSELLIHESTLLENTDKMIPGHSFLQDVIAFANITKTKKLICNHISPRYDKKEASDILTSYVSKSVLKDIKTASDLEVFEI